MTAKTKDSLLISGSLLARFLQVVCGLAGGLILLLIPVVVLISQGLLPGLGGANGSDTIKASPLSVIAILSMLALILAALFQFFGKLRAIIVSVGDGDPFTPDNASRLDSMAWLFLGMKVLVILVGLLRFRLANLVNDGSYERESFAFDLYDADAIVIVVVLFILARIFRHGAAMREDLKGTV